MRLLLKNRIFNSRVCQNLQPRFPFDQLQYLIQNGRILGNFGTDDHGQHHAGIGHIFQHALGSSTSVHYCRRQYPES